MTIFSLAYKYFPISLSIIGHHFSKKQKKKTKTRTCDPNIFLSKKYSITNNLITRDSGG